MVADPRDPAALEPPASSFPRYYSHHYHHQHHQRRPPLHHSVSNPSLPSSSSASYFAYAKSKLPQSQFSLEYRQPVRKRASTASATAAQHHQHKQQQQCTSTTTTNVQHRRSVPNFSLPHVASQFWSSHPSPLSTLNQNILSTRPREVDFIPGDDALSPNASKRRRQSALIAHQTACSLAKDIMPSSTLTYSHSRSSFAADGKSRAAVNGVGSGKQSQLPPPPPTHENNTNGTTPHADDSRSRNEDLFLNIARSDSGRRNSLTRSEFRRSRFGLSNSLRSPTSRVNNDETTPSPEQLRFSNPNPPLRSHTFGSVSHPHSSVSAHPLDDHSRSHYAAAVGPSSRSTIGLPRSRLSRTSPDASPQTPATTNLERRASLQDPRGFGHSTLSTIRGSRQPSSEATERVRVEPEKTRQDGTESTLSTNAPSTVWDELEDLKSRIRKLELTGKLPPSSQAAMSASGSGERPRTAATTATTLSSSPKNYAHKTSFPSADSEAVANQVHPLLQSALAKTKSMLSNEVYKALEATVNDATALSTVLGSGSAISSSTSVANGYSPSDRQSRRKADSVCRGLTELCLALSDDRLKQEQRPPSQDDTIKAQHPNGNTEEPSTPVHPFQRSSSFEPEGGARRRSNTRVVSRLEARRASLANTSPANKDDTPPVPTQQLPSQTQAQPQSQSQPQEPQSATPARARINRLSTSMRTRRQEDENPEKGTLHNRTLSRAMTEIATPASSNRLGTRQRFSHGYMPSQSIPNSPQEQSYTPKTPQHPPSQISQPQQSQQQQERSSQPPRTPSISQSGIPLRRSFMAPVTYTPYNPHTPATSRSNIQAGSRRYGSSFSSVTPSGPMTGNTTNTPETPQPATPSQTRIVAPSTKLAGSYTPIQHNRTRTNSLGTRRFGIRSRPTVNVDNTINDRLS